MLHQVPGNEQVVTSVSNVSRKIIPFRLLLQKLREKLSVLVMKICWVLGAWQSMRDNMTIEIHSQIPIQVLLSEGQQKGYLESQEDHFAVPPS